MKQDHRPLDAVFCGRPRLLPMALVAFKDLPSYPFAGVSTMTDLRLTKKHLEVVQQVTPLEYRDDPFGTAFLVQKKTKAMADRQVLKMKLDKLTIQGGNVSESHSCLSILTDTRKAGYTGSLFDKGAVSCIAYLFVIRNGRMAVPVRPRNIRHFDGDGIYVGRPGPVGAT